MNNVLDKDDIELMRHAIGWPGKHRNHFVTSLDSPDGKRINKLVELGLMRLAKQGSPLSGGDPIFAVTQDGIIAAENTLW